MIIERLQGPEWAVSQQKRVFDVVGMTGCLTALGPAGIASAGAIAAIDRVDPFYEQKRIGLDGQPFPFYKLRTMPSDTPETPSQGSGADPRATKLGRLLRSAHFDEIPQALNVYRGEMSLVGPRALIREDYEHTLDILSRTERQEWLNVRTVNKPGIFGLFQLEQHAAGYDHHDEPTAYRRAMSDIQFGQYTSLAYDLGIIKDSVVEAVRSVFDRPEYVPTGRTAARMLRHVAQGMGVDVTDDQYDYWRLALLAIRHIDDLIDEEGVKDVGFALEDILNGKPCGQMDQAQAAEFQNVYWLMPKGQRSAFLEFCMALPVFQSKKQQAVDADELSTICRVESDMFAKVLEIPTEDDTFNRWVQKFLSTGYMADVLLDLTKDYKSGSVSVLPTLSNRAHFFGQGLLIGADALRTTPPRSYRHIAHTALKTLLY